MLREINSKLRKAAVIVGTAVFIYKVIEEAKEEKKEVGDGFQQKEYDDIW